MGPTTDTAPIRMDRNLFTCNYRAYFPIDVSLASSRPRKVHARIDTCATM